MFFSTIASGSKGNCTLIGTDNTKILVDAGVSATKISRALKELGEDPGNINGIFITHEHTDHIAGVEQMAKKYQIKIYASPKTWAMLPFKNNIPQNQQITYTYDMTLGDLTIDFCKIRHDATEPVGFVFKSPQQKLGFVTDTGSVTNSMLNKLKNLNGIILEANHNLNMLAKGPYPRFLKNRILSPQGHLSNNEAAKFLNYLVNNTNSPKPLQVVLAHLSETNNSPKQAYNDISQALKIFGINNKLSLNVAPSTEVLPKIYLKEE